MTVAIHQPNFLPWIGYFNKIKNSDLFVFLDDVQFERGKTFTSRTKIIINENENWLTVPVMNKSELLQIKDINVDKNFKWKKKHLKSIELNYKKYPYFNEVFSIIVEIYKKESEFLIDYNIPFILSICKYLEINTRFVKSSELLNTSEKSGWEKLLGILIEVKADTYISGSGEGSKRYVNKIDLLQNNINLEWQAYKTKKYAQLNSKNFISDLSIIDLLFNYGNNAVQYI